MSLLEEIRIALAQVAPQTMLPVPRDPDRPAGWVMQEDPQTSCVFFVIEEQIEVYEEFAGIRMHTAAITLQGAPRNCLVLLCLTHAERDNFALIAESFLNPDNRASISADPALWWKRWSDLLGNASTEQIPHAVIGELLVWKALLDRGYGTVIWSGPNKATHDLVADVFDVEVKSTTERYGYRIGISGQHQLSVPQGKSLHLAFMRFERDDAGYSINSLEVPLAKAGVDRAALARQISGLGYHRGQASRDKRFKLLEACVYTVDVTFPMITPASFVGGVVPACIGKIQYEIDLSLLTPVSLDNFIP